MAVMATAQTPLASLKNPQLKSLVKWKKRKGDEALPTTKCALIDRWNQTSSRIDQSLNEYILENKPKDMELSEFDNIEGNYI